MRARDIDRPKFNKSRLKYNRSYYSNNREAFKSWRARSHLLKKYKISLEDYDKLMEKQNGRCAICGMMNSKRNLCVDHCHSTGRVRGLLCIKCNVGIGGLRDSIELLASAMDYLKST